MAIDSASPRTRRALLGAALGAGAATIASALGRPLAVRAGVDGDVVLGVENTATTVTTITNSAADSTAFQAIATGGDYGTGIVAESTTKLGTGVRGTGEYEGVAGIGGAIGVYGLAAGGSWKRGVLGETDGGTGVRGQASSGTGLYGVASSGYALRTYGRVRFDKSVGVATIAAGAKSVTVNPGINVVATSAVVATLQGSAGGTTTVHRCSVSPNADTFTIYLTANAVSATKVAWHLFG